LSTDEILPMTVYVVLKAQLQNLYANIEYMQNFQVDSNQLNLSHLSVHLANFIGAVKHIHSGALAPNHNINSEPTVSQNHRRKSSASVAHIPTTSSVSTGNISPSSSVNAQVERQRLRSNISRSQSFSVQSVHELSKTDPAAKTPTSASQKSDSNNMTRFQEGKRNGRSASIANGINDVSTIPVAKLRLDNPVKGQQKLASFYEEDLDFNEPIVIKKWEDKKGSKNKVNTNNTSDNDLGDFLAKLKNSTDDVIVGNRRTFK